MDLEQQYYGILDTKKITSVIDAIEIVAENCDGRKRNFSDATQSLESLYQGKDNDNPYVDSRYKFPFGIWFRGQPLKCLHLKPSLYRETRFSTIKHCEDHDKSKEQRKPENSYYDETSMFRHFQYRMPNYASKNYSYFDWLCFMQHYELPTRLLDWTENILVALYFVVKNKQLDDCDGMLFAMNSARLNEISSLFTRKRQIFDPSSLDVVVRSVLSVVRTRSEFISVLKDNGLYDTVIKEIKYPILKDWLSSNKKSDLEKIIKSTEFHKANRLGFPIAVYPNRLIERMAMQLSVMTIYGGKVYDIPREKNYIIGLHEQTERLPIFRSMFSIEQMMQNGEIRDFNNAEYKKQFLKSFIVPKGCKVKIREELKRIGIHDVSMFPEIEYQAQFIKKQWKIDNNMSDYLE
jgi:hypothetical protein